MNSVDPNYTVIDVEFECRKVAHKAESKQLEEKYRGGVLKINMDINKEMRHLQMLM